MSEEARSTRVFTVPVTCSVDGYSHQVPDDAMVAGMLAGSGRYEALCGRRVAAALMVCPPGPPCPSCRVYLRARAALREFAPKVPSRRGRSGWLARLCRKAG